MRYLIILLLSTSLVKADGDVLFQIGSNAVKQTINDTDMQRMIDHAFKSYNDPLVPLTPDEAVQRMMTDVINSIFGNVISGEKASAAKDAADTIQAITPVKGK